MPNPENLVPFNFKPGQSGNPNGRPRKWVSSLKLNGYKKSEIQDAISVLISMSEDEITEVSLSKDVTVMEKVIALAILESIKKKSLYNIETLFTRVHGQPKQEIEQEIKGEIKITFNLDDNLPPKTSE